jgi:DNA-nicking Smr family endonuclease
VKRHHAGPKQPARPADDDAARREFEEAMAGVVPLPRDRPGRVRRGPPQPPPAAVRLPRSTPRRDEDGSPPDDFAAPGVDRREIRKLKRGDYRIERTLDLHGWTAPQARRDVTQFIENSRHARLRCVCIVHGKGLNSAGGVPVLRNEVRAHLQALPGVLAYAVAPPRAGGMGAVCVLLRRA